MEQVSINVIPEEAIAYNYKEVGINNLAKLRYAKVQLGRFGFICGADLLVWFYLWVPSFVFVLFLGTIFWFCFIFC